jgi:colicin import membrane protein
LERERLEAEQKEREQAEARQQEEARQEAQRAEEKRQQQLVADKQRKTAEQNTAAATRKASDDRKRAATLKAQQAEKQKAEREAREQTQREAELKRQLADEEGMMQVQNSGLLNQYVALIQQHVIRHWTKPASARPGIQCEVKVTQSSGGVVLSVKVDKCNGDDAVRQSIETAVNKASPLPLPPDARLFQRVLLFVFNPKE